jgi:hypothetical protein
MHHYRANNEFDLITAMEVVKFRFSRTMFCIINMYRVLLKIDRVSIRIK